MADSHPKRDEREIQAFIVRVWYEAIDENGDCTHLRGVVEKVGSSERAYFQDLSKVIGFIKNQLGIKPERSTSQWPLWVERLKYVFGKKTDQRT